MLLSAVQAAAFTGLRWPCMRIIYMVKGAPEKSVWLRGEGTRRALSCVGLRHVAAGDWQVPLPSDMEDLIERLLLSAQLAAQQQQCACSPAHLQQCLPGGAAEVPAQTGALLGYLASGSLF